MRSFITVTVLILFPSFLFADVAIPVLAPDPGPAPVNAPAMNPAMLVAAIFFSTAALLFVVGSYARGKITRQRLIVVSAGLMLFTWGGMIIWMIFSPANEDYLKWQEANRKWKNKEVVGQLFDSPERPDDLIFPTEPESPTDPPPVDGASPEGQSDGVSAE